MKKYVAIFAIVASLTGMTYSSIAHEQDETKRTISKIYMHSKWINPPVEYTSVKVRGNKVAFSSMFEKGNETLQKPVSPEAKFKEGDDFWEHISLDVKNVSDRTIVYLKTHVYLYSKDGVETRVPDVPIAIEFG